MKYVHFFTDKAMLGTVVDVLSDGNYLVRWIGEGYARADYLPRYLTEVDLPDDYQPTHIKPWEMPRSYFGECWPGWYSSGFERSRDSDCLEESNFWAVVKALGGESEDVRIVRESHWAVGWVEWIAIEMHRVDLLWIADALNERYADYPSLDEDDWCRREVEYADDVWRDCYDVAGRIAYIKAHPGQFEFRDFADMIGCVRGKYFAGYASALIS
jgi:hypothetical protein